jgi:hypothetical protein
MVSVKGELDGGVLADWSVPRDLNHVSEARRRVRALAETVLGCAERAHDVAVCASETIGNAVRHGKGDQVSAREVGFVGWFVWADLFLGHGPRLSW